MITYLPEPIGKMLQQLRTENNYENKEYRNEKTI